jgi:16S rRNA (cytosine1402-N4)-methyltransferase
MAIKHIPVLLHEVLNTLIILDNDLVIDATFGGGGHTCAILNANTTCKVVGIDIDETAIERAVSVSQKFPGRFRFVNTNFSNIDIGEKADAILFDFGVSSFQIDSPERGFSFMSDGPLDMRMSGRSHDRDENELSAMDIVNTFSEKDLSDIIYNYGEERQARKIAKSIVSRRKEGVIDTTIKLKNVINEVFGNRRISRIENATKTFQAIRIYVNDELRSIDTALSRLPDILKDGARIVTISFHSLEDRIVKHWAKRCCENISPINKKVVRPSREEVLENPRSRSAIMRGFIYHE